MINAPKIHVYHGDGKGKTTAAVGLCVRARSYGNRVLFCSFLKDGSSGEVSQLKKLGVDTEFLASEKFTWLLNSEEITALKTKTSEFFNKINKKAKNYDLVILDEALDAVGTGLLDEGELLRFFSQNTQSEIVVTGRNPSENLLLAADYVTEMVKIKHPFDKNITAREGIEK